MKTWLSIACAAVVLAVGVYASQPRAERPATGPDGKGQIMTNESAAEVHTISGSFERIVVVRLRRGTDLLEGMKKAVEREGIRNAAILSGVGSLTSYHVHAVGNTAYPVKNVYFKAEGPQDLLNVNGYVIDGRIHAHIMFSDEKKGLGGHLEPGTTVYTFAVITMGVLKDGVSLARFDDPGW
jgi:predicted DNA-binding protein with PD1-like motif